MGRLGSCRPARERRTASDTASTASSWPTTRWCRRSSMWTSFSISPSSIVTTGMPVHLATTSAMSSASTTSLRKFVLRSRLGVRSACLGGRELLLELGDRAVLELGGAAEVGLALRALEPRSCACSSCSWSSATRRRRSPSRAATRRASRPSCSFTLGDLALELLAASRGAWRPSSSLERLLLDLELHDVPLDLVDLGRHGVDLHAEPRGRLVDQVDRLVGQEAVGDVAVRRASPRRRAPRPGCGRRGGPRSAP